MTYTEESSNIGLGLEVGIGFYNENRGVQLYQDPVIIGIIIEGQQSEKM